MNKKNVFFVVIPFLCALAISACENNHDNVKIVEIISITPLTTKSPTEMKDSNLEILLNKDTDYESNTIEFIKENKSILDNYNVIFTEEWSEKKISLDIVQDETLGWRWHHTVSAPSNTLAHFANSGLVDGINCRINLSILRIIADSLVKNYLENDNLNGLKDILGICVQHKIHLWTSPGISKEQIGRKRAKIIESDVQVQKNTIKKSFKLARQRLFRKVNIQIENFVSNINFSNINVDQIENQKIVINQDCINQLALLYSLAKMTHDIHQEIYSDYDPIISNFENITEKDVLQHIAPEKINRIEEIQKQLESIKRSAKLAKNEQEELSKIEISSNLLDNSVFDS